MKNKVVLSPAAAIPGEIMKEITLIPLDSISGAAGCAVRYLSGGEPKSFWFHMFPGGGKSHLLKYIQTTVKAHLKSMSLSWLNLNGDIDVILSPSDFLQILSNRVGGIEKINSWTELESLIKSKRHSILTFIEKPFSLFADGLKEILEKGSGAGSMFLIFSDSPPPSDLELFDMIKLPSYSISQLKNILALRNLPAKIISNVERALSYFNFIHRTPSSALALAKIFLLEDDISLENALTAMLDDASPHYKSRLNKLSPQQRKLLTALAESEFMLSPKEISEVTSLEIPVINSQMKRLRDEGILISTGTVQGGKSAHYFHDYLFRSWIRQESSSSELPYFGFIRRWRQWRQAEGPPLIAYVYYLRKSIIPLRKPVNEIRFITDLANIPTQPFEPLAKVFIGYIRGENYQRAENMTEAETERSLNLGQKGRAARAMFFTGIARLLQNKLEAAFSAFKSAENHGEKDPRLSINLGSIHYLKGNLNIARNYFEAASKSGLKIPHSRAGLGIIYLEAEDSPMKAAPHIERALEIDPEFTPALIAQGNILWSRGEYLQALNLFKRAIETDADNLNARLSAADIAFSLKLYDESAEYNAQIVRSTEDSKVAREVIVMYCSAVAVSALNHALEQNYGLAEETFMQALVEANLLDEATVADIFLPFFFALTTTAGCEFWHRLFQSCQDADLNSVTDKLWLHRLALDIKQNPDSGYKFRLFPQEREALEEILTAFSTTSI